MARIRRLGLFVGAIAVALFPAHARAQGLIIDRRPNIPIARSYDVRDVSVDARVRDQVAEVQVSQTFHNPGSFPLEAEYLFPMPDEGVISNFVLMVDGKELPGRLLPKDEARRIYEEVVRTKRDPALLEYMGRGLYRTSVFPIPPGADRKVTLRYTQLCRRDKDVVEFSYPFGTQKFTAKPIERLALRLEIRSNDALKSVYCPSHEVTISRSGEREATVTLEQRDVVPTADFRLVYTLAEGTLGASVLSYRPSDSEDGYFLLLASPEVKAAEERASSKTVICVLDRSGSMTGKKIDQAKGALKFVLDNLRDDDTFNIIVYDDRVESFKPELQRYSRDSRAEAMRFVENIRAGGSTNINGALGSALEMLRDDDRPHYVLFLTDGLPTAGETRETAIAENARKANKTHARLFVFGVGYDVNSRLLDRLSGGNGGTSEYVKPDEDIEARVARFYGKFTSPVLAGITIDVSSTDVNRTYPRDIPDLFVGGQLVWVGRYRQSGKSTVRIAGKVGAEKRSLEFQADLASAGHGSAYDFVEKLWAMRRLGYLIDQIDLHGQNKELTDELVALSTKYGILTPYTSFLADERVRLHDHAANYESAKKSLEQLSEVTGSSANAQRGQKGGYLRAENAQQAYAPAAPSAGAGFGGGGGGRMMSGAAAGKSANGGSGVSTYAALTSRPGQNYVAFKDAAGNDQVATSVRQQGKKTFFRKENRWVDADVTAADESKAIVVEQFSDAFFDLARNQSADWNQYLTFDEPVIVNLAGKTYRIEPGKK